MSANLIIQTAFLGDLLLSIPLLKRVRKNWPDQEVFLVCRQGFGEFFLKTGLVDRTFEIVKGDSSSYAQALDDLSKYSIGFVISPHESWRTMLFCKNIKAKHKISYKNIFKYFFFQELIKRDKRLPDPLRQLSLLSGQDTKLKEFIADYVCRAKPFSPSIQGHLSEPPTWASMNLRDCFFNKQEDFEMLLERLLIQQELVSNAVLLFPGSVWATKRWITNGYIETGRALIKQGFQIIVMGGPGEELLSEKVAAEIPGSFCFAGKTSIYESALMISRSRLVIGNDSASTHLASACEVPLIAIFGPTILEFGYRPWSAQAYIAEKVNLTCRPCGKHGHKKCPIGTHECMIGISSHEILLKAQFILKNK